MLTPQPPLDMALDNVGWVLTQVGGPATCAVACVVVKSWWPRRARRVRA
jgi:hypothetical protein